MFIFIFEIYVYVIWYRRWVAGDRKKRRGKGVEEK